MSRENILFLYKVGDFCGEDPCFSRACARKNELGPSRSVTASR